MSEPAIREELEKTYFRDQVKNQKERDTLMIHRYKQFLGKDVNGVPLVKGPGMDERMVLALESIAKSLDYLKDAMAFSPDTSAPDPALIIAKAHFEAEKNKQEQLAELKASARQQQ